MIDFQNGTFFKLSPIDPQILTKEIAPLLVPDEEVLSAFKGIRDSVLFTNKRVIALNVQGMTGKKRDYTSLPYSKVQAFSVETAGTCSLVSILKRCGLITTGLSKLLNQTTE